jgi:hypothetical protein
VPRDFHELQKSSKGEGDLTVNESKMKYVEATKNLTDLQYWAVSGYKFE